MTAREQRAGRHVLDHHALVKAHGLAAAALPLAHDRERVQELVPEAAAGDDLERARLRVMELNVTDVGTGDRDGGVDDVLEQRGRVVGADQAGAHLLQPGHAGQLGGQVLLALAQRRGGLDLIGDVEAVTDVAQVAPVLAEMRQRARLEPAPLAVAAARPGAAVHRPVTADRLEDLGQIGRRVVRVQEGAPSAAVHILVGQPEELEVAPVDVARAGVLVEKPDHRRRRVGQGAELGLALDHRALGVAQVGDVLGGAEDPARSPLVVQLHLRARVHEAFGAVEAPRAPVVLERLVVVQSPGKAGVQDRQIFGVHVLAADLVGESTLSRRQPEHAEDLIRPDQLLAPRVVAPVADVGQALRLGQPRLARAQQSLGLLLGGDVLRHRHDADDLAVAIAQRRVPPVAEDGAPVPGDDLAHRVGLGIARHRAAQQLHHVLAAGRRDQEVVRVHTDHLGTAVSEDALGGPVPLEDAQVGIHDEARDRHALELELQARQLRAVGRLGRLGRPGRLGRESGPGAHLRGQLLGRDREQAGRHPLGHLVDGRRLVGSPPSLSTFPHPAATLLLLRGTPSRPGSTCR